MVTARPPGGEDVVAWTAPLRAPTALSRRLTAAAAPPAPVKRAAATVRVIGPSLVAKGTPR